MVLRVLTDAEVQYVYENWPVTELGMPASRQCRTSPVAHVTGDAATSGARGHVGGEDVIGVPVEVLAGPVIARGRAGIGVPGGDLDIAQVDPGIEHGRDECA